MASQLRNPLIIIIIAIIAAVIVISSLGGLETPSPEGLSISNLTLENDRIKMGENTTLTVEIEFFEIDPHDFFIVIAPVINLEIFGVEHDAPAGELFIFRIVHFFQYFKRIIDGLFIVFRVV